MKNRKELIRQFIFIIVIGLAVAVFSGEYKWQAALEPLEGAGLEAVLDTLNLVLPILAMVLGLGVVLYFQIWGKPDEGSDWEEE